MTCTELNNIEKREEHLKLNKGAIETLEEYINTAKSVHDFTYSEGMSASDQASRNIYKFFASDRSYYNSIAAHLASVTPEGIENAMLTTDEFEEVKTFILCGFIPAEAVYWYFAKGKPVDFTEVGNAWDTYTQLEPKVTDFIQEKKKYVLDYFSHLQVLRIDVDAYLKEIQSFPENY